MEDLTLAIISTTLFIIAMIVGAAWLVISTVRKKNNAEIKLKEEQLQKQKEIARNTLNSQEAERKRIGMDLHDDLGPSFSVIKMNIGQVKHKISKGAEADEVIDLLNQAGGHLEDAVSRFSNLSKLLYPVVLNRLGLNAALQDLIAKAQNNEVSIQGMISAGAPPNDVFALSVYRMAQELLNNGLKHAHASEMELHWVQVNGHYLLHYSDNGKGFNKDQQSLGIGMQSLKSRSEAIGGALEINSSSTGTEIRIKIPRDEKD